MVKSFLTIMMAFSVFSALSQPDIAVLNSVYDESKPILAPDGNTIYFVRRNHPDNTGGKKDKGDIYFSTFADTAWTAPKNAGPLLNSVDDNGVVGFSADGQIMYLYGHYTGDQSKARTQGISQSFQSGGQWSSPQKLPIEYFLNKSDETGICFSADGRVMVLSLDSFGSYGGEDLYISFLQPDGTWSQPKNMGSTLNTSLQEMTPTISQDQTKIYFASNGHSGFGSRDIFVSSRIDNSWKNWSTPKNLGPKVNSEGLELSFQFISDDMAMFITTQNSDGYGDIRLRRFDDNELLEIRSDSITLDIPENPVVDLREVQELTTKDRIINVFGKVTNANTATSLRASIRFIGEKGFEQLLSSDAAGGNYAITLPSDDSYRIELEAPGFLAVHEGLELRTQELSLLELNFNLYPIEVGTTIKLDHVNFYQGTADLIESSFDQLDIVTQMMKDNPNINIDLSGHTDNRGSFRLNLQLSQDRVEKVKEYLIGHGIAAARVSGKGYGGTRPIASNAGEETRKLNRRVEFTIVE